MKTLKYLWAVIIACVAPIATAMSPVASICEIDLNDGSHISLPVTHEPPVTFSEFNGHYYLQNYDSKICVDDIASMSFTEMPWPSNFFVGNYGPEDRVDGLDISDFPYVISDFIRDTPDFLKYVKFDNLPDWIEILNSEEIHSLRFKVLPTTDERREASFTATFPVEGDNVVYFTIKQFGTKFLTYKNQKDPSLWSLVSMGCAPEGDKYEINYTPGAVFSFDGYWVNINGEDVPGYKLEDFFSSIDIDDESGIATFVIKPNPTDEIRTIGLNNMRFNGVPFDEEYIDYYEGFTYPYTNFGFKQYPKSAPTKEQLHQLLVDLYNSTDGPHWFRNKNWLTNAEYKDWENVRCNGHYINEISLTDNRLVGEYPCETITGLWSFGNPHLEKNGFYGRLSDEIQSHPHWQDYGLQLLMANPWWTGSRRYENYKRNLKIKNQPVLMSDGTTIDFYNLLARYDMMHVLVAAPDEMQCNMHLDYRSHGFTTLAACQDWFGLTFEQLQQTANNFPIDDVLFAYNSLGYDVLNYVGSTYLIDSEGYIQDVFMCDWEIPEDVRMGPIYDTLRERYGEPDEHEYFTFPETEIYTSTDYSRDGEVTVLQEATVGRGIDVVLMGDGYTDRDIDSGKYLDDMRATMEYFFADEPYTTLRDRFNVYAVTVVSPNGYEEGGTQRINGDENICFEYAARTGRDLKGVTIIDMHNNSDVWRVEGYTNMYIDGSSVAHIIIGGPSGNVIHEAGGHGFAKLLDEYIYSGFEENSVPEENVEAFEEWIRNDYHSLGWGMNVSATDDPALVPWARFLEDERYDAEIGIYQGAWYWPTNLWRPSENSVMRHGFTWFNAPSREAIYKRIMRQSEPEGWEYDYETFVRFDREVMARAARRAKPAEPFTRKVIHHAPKIIDGRDNDESQKSDFHAKKIWK